MQRDLELDTCTKEPLIMRNVVKEACCLCLMVMLVVSLCVRLVGRVAFVKQILIPKGLKDGKQKFTDNILYPACHPLSAAETLFHVFMVVFMAALGPEKNPSRGKISSDLRCQMNI